MTVSRSAGRWLALVAIAASVLVVGLDLTVLNLALPSIAVSLHGSTSDLQWIADSYSLVLAALILPAGLLGDRYGRKRILLIAIVLFGLSSLACAYATSIGELIAARGGARRRCRGDLPARPVRHPGAVHRGGGRPKAIAAIAGSTMLSFPIGPIVGGYLLDHFWWGSVFLINVPIVVLAVIAVVLLLPESRSARRPSIDLAGLAVSTIGLVALTYGFIKASQDGWSDVTAIALIVIGAVVLALLYFVERRIARRGGQPLADLSLFASPGFRWGTILATMVSFAMFGLFFALPAVLPGRAGREPARQRPAAAPDGRGHAGRHGHRHQAEGAADRDPGRLHADGRGHGARRADYADQLDRLHAGLGGAGRPRPRPGDAQRDGGPPSAPCRPSAAGPARPCSPRCARSARRSAWPSSARSSATATARTWPARRTGCRLPPRRRSGPEWARVVALAQQLGSASLLHTVRTGFVNGMDLMLWICCGIAVGSAILAAAVLRTRPASRETVTEAVTEVGAGVDAT